MVIVQPKWKHNLQMNSGKREFREKNAEEKIFLTDITNRLVHNFLLKDLPNINRLPLDWIRIDVIEKAFLCRTEPGGGKKLSNSHNIPFNCYTNDFFFEICAELFRFARKKSNPILEQYWSTNHEKKTIMKRAYQTYAIHHLNSFQNRYA